jgi:hypothetical protein
MMMALLKKVGKFLLGGGLVGMGVRALTKKKKDDPAEGPLSMMKPATRDDALIEAERERELARRRGASADRIVSGGGLPAGGLGRLIVGS